MVIGYWLKSYMKQLRLYKKERDGRLQRPSSHVKHMILFSVISLRIVFQDVSGLALECLADIPEC